MRLWIPEILFNEEKVLYLDIDIVVNDCIEELWDIDMTKYCLAMCHEKGDEFSIIVNNKKHIYCNSGVAMFNIPRLKETGKDKEMISLIESKKFQWPDQDVMNIVCNEEIYVLPFIYNTWGGRTLKIENPKIIHYAGIPPKPWVKRIPSTELWWKYRDMLDNK